MSAALWVRRDKFTRPAESCGGKGMAWPLSQGESNPTLALTGFYWLSNILHQRRFSFVILRFALGNYFSQIATERMLLITSYRLTRKRCCKCKGTIRVIGQVTLQSLGELAQTSGTQGDGVLARARQAWFPTGEPIREFGILPATGACGLSHRAELHLPLPGRSVPCTVMFRIRCNISLYPEQEI